MDQFTPLHKDIIVKVEIPLEPKTESGIFLVEQKSVLKRPTEGIVVAKSDKVTEIEIGDKVFWNITSGIDLDFNGEKHVLLQKKAVMGIIKKEDLV